ncbi:MAG: peptidoglycan DD-metalloendopeptidase family protein, partial [Legionella sp.]|nr:peptidoglycan DD-metalloendopeptidase family protein [Legionella sp.]
LITMGLAKPKNAWQYASITTVFSVLGGCFGYLLGFFGMAIIEPYILSSSYALSYGHVRGWFTEWGIWIIFLAGFSPIPYKIFTVTAGIMHMLFWPFALASLIGRGARFFLVATLLVLFGEKLERHLRRWIDWVGWTVVAIIVICLFLFGCGTRNEPAPIEESKWYQNNLNATRHSVRAGETLYAVAFRYDQDYHDLATLNHINAPYKLRVGQVIQLKPQTKSILNALPELPVFLSNHQWTWPLKGRIATNFSPNKGQKGIDIAGKKGQKIHAASAGVVAYAGNGLPGYGNLIILKHDNQYLTAYANNQRNLVRVGQSIKKDAVIAEIGVVNRRFWGLHFEIRKQGKPVNPLNYLH